MLASPRDVWDGTTRGAWLRALSWRTAWFPLEKTASQRSGAGAVLPHAGAVLGKGLSPSV